MTCATKRKSARISPSPVSSDARRGAPRLSEGDPGRTGAAAARVLQSGCVLVAAAPLPTALCGLLPCGAGAVLLPRHRRAGKHDVRHSEGNVLPCGPRARRGALRFPT